jgi:soluble lytic murein transglycosylase
MNAPLPRSARAARMRAYPWRFPMVEKGKVNELSQRWQVDPALVYGLMRAESAMQARCPVTGRGARSAAIDAGYRGRGRRRNSLPYNGQAGLMDPAINIPLGVAHLAELERATRASGSTWPRPTTPAPMRSSAGATRAP